MFPDGIIWRVKWYCYMEREKLVEKKSDFYTLKGYQQMEEGSNLTASMEDYLEMICRMYKDGHVVRIKELAERLNVRPSSASKMANNLRMLKLITFEKYGYIGLTEKGAEIGKYLLYRHDVLNRFLCFVNQSDNETKQVEKIEHFLNKKTIDNINRLNNMIIGKIKIK